MPPRMLKRPFSGNSSVAGMPATKNAMIGNPMISPSTTRPTGDCWPVFSCFLRAQRA